MNSGTAYLKKTAYLKCLLLSTWDQILMKLKTLTENEAKNSIKMQDMINNELRIHRSTKQ